jgi:hypothetical protein
MPDHTMFAGADTAAAQAFQTALDDVLHVTATAEPVRLHIDRCPSFVHGQLLLVLLALAEGDLDGANDRLDVLTARGCDMPRRHRQLCEIVGLVVHNDRYRFQILTTEHLAEHPDDHGLLVAAEIALAHAARPTP